MVKCTPRYLIPALHLRELAIQDGKIYPWIVHSRKSRAGNNYQRWSKLRQIHPSIVYSRSWFAGMNYQRWSNTPSYSSFLQIKRGKHLPMHKILYPNSGHHKQAIQQKIRESNWTDFELHKMFIQNNKN